MRRCRSLSLALVLGAPMAFGCSTSSPPPAAEPGKPAERQVIKIQAVDKKTGKTRAVTRNVPHL
ncbi:MAG TPA: hypothetical protein VFF52_09930 [Isosphaeraceae bacterium]|nr:hypothetical protein [Isosphaeraceae bacterium]